MRRFIPYPRTNIMSGIANQDQRLILRAAGQRNLSNSTKNLLVIASQNMVGNVRFSSASIPVLAPRGIPRG